MQSPLLSHICGKRQRFAKSFFAHFVGSLTRFLEKARLLQTSAFKIGKETAGYAFSPELAGFEFSLEVAIAVSIASSPTATQPHPLNLNESSHKVGHS